MRETGEALSSSVREELPWRRSVAWLLFLGPFFFLSYGFANGWAEARGVDSAIVFGWESSIPFLPWTIVPYWSIDLLYGFSFLLCRDRKAVDTHAARLLTAQLISIGCFLAFPLHYSFQRPAADGLFGAMFDALMGFDKPFNQAPSLHIVLLVVLWVRYAEASRGIWRLITHGWALLICLSVLTTYQHHFIDIPTGILVGLFCIWLWPDGMPSVPRQWQFSPCPIRCRIGRRYLVSALACFGLACVGGWALCFLWPATALGIVGLIYLGLGAPGFQKSGGKLSFASAWLLAPYRAGAWINSRLWTRRHPCPVEVADGVWLGRLPAQQELEQGGFSALLDLTAEFSTPRGAWHSVNQPWLDLLPPDSGELTRAAAHIEQLHRRGKVLVYCALGYSRSAAAVAAWLLATGRASTVAEATATMAARRPEIVLGEIHLGNLQAVVPDRA